MKERIRRVGFGARLFLAFGVVGIMTVTASAIAWFAFDRLSAGLGVIAEESLPAMERATRLADAGGSLIATAPTLAAAETDEDRRRAWEDLSRLLRAMEELAADVQPAPELGRLVVQIRDNLFSLNDNVTQRLGLAEASRALMEALRWTHADFLDEVEPLIEDVRFNVTLAIERLRDPAAPELASLSAETRHREALQEINAAGNLIVGLIARSAGLSDRESVVDATYFMGETADRLREKLAGITDLPGAVSLRQISESLVDFAEGQASVPSLRGRELEAQAEGRRLLAVNRDLVEQLRGLIARQVNFVHASTASAATSSTTAISGGRAMLVATTFASLLLAALVAWLYVGRNLVARVTALGRSMRAIAAGDLDAPVPLGGSDEISDMAEALLVFRNTALEVEEANAQSIIDNTVAGLLTTDEQGVIETVNSTAERLFGSAAETIRGRPLAGMLDAKAARLVEGFFTGEAQAALAVADASAIRADGSRLAVDLAIRAFRQRARRRYIVTVQDVSERAHAQELLERRVAERTAKLRDTNKKLRAEVAERERAEAEMRQTQTELVQAGKLAALGEMSAGIAHELNQPLSAIRSYAHNATMLLDRGRAEDVRVNLGKIEDLTQRMAQVSQHLKTFARKPAEALGPVDLRTTSVSALSLFAGRIARQGVEVVDGIATGLWVLAEPIRLEQVLVNLLANALDAMRQSRLRRLTLESRREGGTIIVAIADTGAGMDVATRGRVFDPFFTTKEVGHGLGLGLSISYNIVKDFGGTLAFESAEGRGTTFRITLQAA